MSNPPSPITVLIPANKTEAAVELVVSADPNDDAGLVVSHDGQALVDLQCLIIDYVIGQIVSVVIEDFDDSIGQTWTLTAAPLTRASASGTSWTRDSSGKAYDEDSVAWPHGSSELAVTITAETTANGQTKQRRRVIHIKMQTSNPGGGGKLGG